MRTRLFSRVLGPFMVIVSAIAFAHSPEKRILPISDFGVWPWATGAFLLMAGLVVIALHQYWHSIAAVIVSLLGWLMALRGFFILGFPAAFDSIASSVQDATALWQTVYICLAVIGLYLTYVGRAPPTSKRKSKAKESARDLPHAA